MSSAIVAVESGSAVSRLSSMLPRSTNVSPLTKVNVIPQPSPGRDLLCLKGVVLISIHEVLFVFGSCSSLL